MLYRWAQLVLPLVQVMQDFSFELGLPPHTTSLPPERRERLWPFLGPGKSGMEHVSEEGGGKISTEESWSLPSYPPTTSCPDAKIVKDNVMRKETANIIDEESFCRLEICKKKLLFTQPDFWAKNFTH